MTLLRKLLPLALAVSVSAFSVSATAATSDLDDLNDRDTATAVNEQAPALAVDGRTKASTIALSGKATARCRAIIERAQLGDIDPEDIDTLRSQCR